MAYTNIDKPEDFFSATIYTGDGSASQSMTGSGFKPDFLWIKRRNASERHVLTNVQMGVSSGAYKWLDAASTEGEFSGGTGVASFDSDGFTIKTSDATWNASGSTYVFWSWKANGGTTASNSNGSITSTVQANTTSGCSIVTYTGTGSAATVGHGLADTPDVIIFKNRSGSNVWAVYHQSLGNNVKIVLNGNDAQDADGAFMNGTLPTSSVFSVGASANTNTSSSNYVAYCFAGKQGYSKFSSYIGNGESLNGPFVYTGFKPAWVMIKNADNVNGRNWYIYDDTRRTFNPNGTVIRADTDGAEITDQAIDVLSNGFKVKPGAIGSYGTSNINNSGQEMIYMAFAENPFVTSTGIPTTAR